MNTEALPSAESGDIDIVSRIQSLGTSPSRAERQLAEVVLQDLNFTLGATGSEIANAAGVSVASVSRFCRTIGFENFRAFKQHLAPAMSVGSRYLQRRIEKGEATEGSARVLASAQQALQILSDQLDFDALYRAADCLSTAAKIVSAGSGGGSSMIALEAQTRLFRLGLSITASTDAQIQLMIAATLDEGDVLLAISTSGLNAELIAAANVAREYGATVIAMTRPGSPLASSADILLPVETPEHPNILMPTPSRYALLALLDILAMETAQHMRETAAEKMRRIKFRMVTRRQGVDNLPLGD